MCSSKLNPKIQKINETIKAWQWSLTHSPMVAAAMHLGFSVLPKDISDMWTVWAGIRAAEPAVVRQPTLPYPVCNLTTQIPSRLTYMVVSPQTQYYVESLRSAYYMSLCHCAIPGGLLKAGLRSKLEDWHVVAAMRGWFQKYYASVSSLTKPFIFR